MAANYVLLEKVTVGSAGAASVTFNNIPQTGYTDLKIVFSTRGTQSALYDGTFLYFNGSNTSVSGKVLQGSGASASSASPSTQLGYFDGSGATATANTFGSGEVYIPNYTSSNYKSVSSDTVSENNGTNAYSAMSAGLWSSTAAITSITFKPAAGSNFVQYSTFFLYGLAAVGTTPVIAPYASGGDIIQTDGTYWYHAFLGSGAFTPAKTLSCDVLVVAGGGGGGDNAGGGGGAGGVRNLASQSFTNGTGYAVTIGAGGPRNPGTSGSGLGGNPSTLGSISASGGGRGGSGNGGTYNSATAGGSGGGGNHTSAGFAGNTGSYSPVEGYAGGDGYGPAHSGTPGYGGGGGGGAGGVGGTAVSRTGANGGVGVTSTALTAMGTATGFGQLSSGNYYFAGGGAGSGGDSAQPGGTGGLGGGGNANTTTTASDGTINTGGGGGGGGYGGYLGGAGGSGVVIIRYAI